MLLGTLMVAGCGTTTVTVTSRTPPRTVTETKTVTRAEARPSPTIFVEQDGALTYKPDTLELGASSAIEQVQWLRYGGPTAVGKGMWGKNDCAPTCADGKITYVPVSVKLMMRVLCRGKIAYSQWSVVGGGFDPTPDALAPAQDPCRP